MKILIHALGACMGGALRHLTNFLPELGKVDPNNEYVVLIRESIPAIETSENIQQQRVPDKEAASLPSRIIGDLVKLPINLKKENYNLIVSLTNFGPIWTPVPHILYQRNPTYFCKYHLDNIKGNEKRKLLMRRFLVVEAMKRADIIVTPSNAMAEMIKETCPSVRNKNFQTIYHGHDNQSLQSTPDEKLKKLLDFDVHKILYPTHAAPHKGFDILFKILYNLKKSVPNFVLFVPMNSKDWPEGIKKSKQMISELNLMDNVIFLGEVPQKQMGYLYQKCDLMIYPSLCESFGFSMI
jgi:glycosyltransferase involved in cell wall biosynthesis